MQTMLIQYTECKAKGGGRNSRRRLSRAARRERRYPLIWARNALAAYPDAPVPVDLSGLWTPILARVALSKLDESGLTQRAFAQAEGFPVGRIPTWRKRLEQKGVDNPAN